MINKFRWYLARLLIGKRPVVANVSIEVVDGMIVIGTTSDASATS